GTDKDVKKVLDSSECGQLQTDTDTSQLQHTNSGNHGLGGVTSESGLNGASSVNYHIRFLSAKPIRAALVRQIELRSKSKASDQMKSFIDQTIEKWIVVAVTVDSSGDARAIGPSASAFKTGTIG